MADALPRFRGIDEREFTHEGMARLLQRYTRDLTVEIERRIGAATTAAADAAKEAASAKATALSHASRHFEPGGSGEDPIPIARLQDAGRVLRNLERPETAALGHGAVDGGVTRFLREDRTWQVPAGGGGGGGDNLQVNGVAVTDANLQDGTPAAPADGANVRWQRSGSGPDAVSANVPVSPNGAATVVGTTRSIATTAPLTGGGDLSANRTLAVSDATGGAKGVVQLAGDLAGTAAAPEIAPHAVTFAKMQALGGLSLLLGKGSVGSPPFDIEEIQPGEGLEMSGTTLFSVIQGSYFPDSYTVPTDKFRIAAKRQGWVSAQRLILQGTARLSIHN